MSNTASQSSDRTNAFGFLRLTLAASVLYSHGYVLGGFGQEPLFHFTSGNMALGPLAVHCFFVISGYLVTESYLRSDSTLRYLWKRLLRIAPAFWVCLAVTAFLLTPFVWALDPTPRHTLAELRPTQWDYLIQNLFRPRTVISVEGIPCGGLVYYGGDWNGSLWTLFYEVACYLMVAGLGVFTVLRRPRLALTILVGFLALHVAWFLAPSAFPAITGRLFDTPGKRETLHFLAGAAWCIALPAHGHHMTRPWIAWACAPLLALSWFSPAHLWLSPLVLPPVTFALARHLPFKAWETRLGGDYSYGLYIYGMPAQQCLAALGVHHHGVATYLACSLLTASGFAWLSWHLIESPALRLKNLTWPFTLARFKSSST
jgi:peptidoglycan/LPS O-acetylase OafA/YrhL